MDMSDRSNLEKLKDITQYRVLKETYIEEMNPRSDSGARKKRRQDLPDVQRRRQQGVFASDSAPRRRTAAGFLTSWSTACFEGSEKFPVKDPFVELVKGSLNTF